MTTFNITLLIAPNKNINIYVTNFIHQRYKMHEKMNRSQTLDRNARMSSYAAGQDFVNVFSSSIHKELSLMIISMDDVDLDGSLVVVNMLLLFGGVANPIVTGVVAIGFSLSLFGGG